MLCRLKLCNIEPLSHACYTSTKFNVSRYFYFLWRFDPIPGPGLPLQGFAITLIGHTTLGKTPLGE